MVVYGVSGVGKTSFCAQWPRPRFLIDTREEGVIVLGRRGLIPSLPPEDITMVESWKELLREVRQTSKGDYDTLVIDSLTGMETLCFRHHCDENFNGDWSKEGFYAYQQGPKNAAKTDWPEFLDALDTVRRDGVNVLLIGHSTVKSHNDPEDPSYDRHVVYLDKETWEQTKRWSQANVFIRYYVQLKKEGLKTKIKQNQGTERQMHTEWSPAFDAKNWLGLPPVIPMGESAEEGFANFLKAFNAGKNFVSASNAGK